MQTKIKHSKYRNSGILFELLIRQITSDLMSVEESKAINILKKFFTNTELAKELSLYNTLLEVDKIPAGSGPTLLQSVCEQSRKLNRVKLEKEKYNLIKEIRKSYDFDNFFKAKIKNYKVSAAIYTLLELANQKDYTDPIQVVSNQNVILEHITKKPLSLEKDSLEEFRKEEKGIKILSYRFLVEKFNEKYTSLTEEQKNLLKEYINNISNTVELKKYLNTKYKAVKQTLSSLLPTVQNKITKIKLEEVVKNIKEITPRENIKDDHLVGLMQYFELIQEIRKTVKNK